MIFVRRLLPQDFSLPAPVFVSTQPVITGLFFAVCLVNGAMAVPADPTHGARLARQWCASCHVVAPDQQGTVAEAPPFSTIAHRPDFDAGRLALFLLDPHPKMPDMALTRSEAADLAAYIATLK